MESRRYVDNAGRMLVIYETGMGGWRAFYRGRFRWKPMKALKNRPTRDEAQADLDEYATKHGLKEA